MWWNGCGAYGMFGGFGMMLFPLLFLVLLAALIVAVSRRPGGGRQPPPQPSGLSVLQERYARGEISREEFLQKKQDIGS